MSHTASLRDYLSLIKFSHSVFALPFAVIALLVATTGRPPWTTVVLVVAAMVCARSAAMAYNRFADRGLDAANPRTKNREIPSGVIRPRAALALTIASCVAFIAVCAALGSACLWLSVPVLAVLLGYSHAKRFTDWSHLWLGVALGLSPPAAWLAAKGTFEPGIWSAALLGVGVALWVAGFDVLYACQDDEFDRRAGLRSLPVRLGRRGAMTAARVFHALAVVAFFGFGAAVGLGWIYHAGVVAVAVTLVIEQRLVAPDDLGRIDMAFFTLNGIVGLALLSFTSLDIYLV